MTKKEGKKISKNVLIKRIQADAKVIEFLVDRRKDLRNTINKIISDLRKIRK